MYNIFLRVLILVKTVRIKVNIFYYMWFKSRSDRKLITVFTITIATILLYMKHSQYQ